MTGPSELKYLSLLKQGGGIHELLLCYCKMSVLNGALHMKPVSNGTMQWCVCTFISRLLSEMRPLTVWLVLSVRSSPHSSVVAVYVMSLRATSNLNFFTLGLQHLEGLYALHSSLVNKQAVGTLRGASAIRPSSARFQLGHIQRVIQCHQSHILLFYLIQNQTHTRQGAN